MELTTTTISAAVLHLIILIIRSSMIELITVAQTKIQAKAVGLKQDQDQQWTRHLTARISHIRCTEKRIATSFLTLEAVIAKTQIHNKPMAHHITTILLQTANNNEKYYSIIKYKKLFEDNTFFDFLFFPITFK